MKRIFAAFTVIITLLVATGAITSVNFLTQVRGIPIVYATVSVAAGGCGMVGDGTTDETSLFNTCVNAASNRTIVFPSKTFIIGDGTIGNGSSSCPTDHASCTTTMSTVSGISLQGSCQGNLFFNTPIVAGACTTFKAPASFTTASGHQVLKVAGPISGVRIEKIQIDGNERASRGLYINTAALSSYSDLVITRAVGANDYNLYIDSTSSIYSGCFNHYYNLMIGGNTSAQRNTGGIALDSNLSVSERDTCSNFFAGIQVLWGGNFGSSYPVHGVYFGASDNDYFTHLLVGRASYGSYTVTSMSVTSGTATITTSPAHGMAANDAIFLQNGSSACISGNFRATRVNSTQMTITTTCANGSYSADNLSPVGIYMGPASFSDGVDIVNTDGGIHWDNTSFAFTRGTNWASNIGLEVGGGINSGDLSITNFFPNGPYHLFPGMESNKTFIGGSFTFNPGTSLVVANGSGSMKATKFGGGELNILSLTTSNDVLNFGSLGGMNFYNTSGLMFSVNSSFVGSGTRAVCATSAGVIYTAAGTTCP